MDLITRLKVERDGRVHGGIYDITQKRFAFNSNKIEGSRLTEEQTSFIYETKTIANIVHKTVLTMEHTKTIIASIFNTLHIV